MQKNQINAVREPLFHVTRKNNTKPIAHILIAVLSVILGLIVGSLICSLSTGHGILEFFTALYDGAFGTKELTWTTLRDSALLLGVSIAVVPAFKMKFWNLGANGQVLVGALAAIICMDFLGGDNSDLFVNILMVFASIIAGIVWAVIPAIFKACFNTNESLFTLMTNYIAEYLVLFYIKERVSSGSGTFPTLEYGSFKTIGGNVYLLPIIIVAVLTIVMSIYLKYSKHGYEISVVGGSKNTAKYIGINVKKVIIRTLVLSGAICGIIGLLLVGTVSPTISSSTHRGYGFTAIMTSWLAGFNPITMVFTCFFVTFVTCGMKTVRSTFGIGNDSTSNLVIGLIYFFLIASEFFVNYKLIFRKKSKKAKKEKKGDK